MSYKGYSKLFLTPEQTEVLRSAFRERGYETGASIAKALFSTQICSEHYRNNYSFGQALGSILRGQRNIPYRIIEGILEICENDERLGFLRKSPNAAIPVKHEYNVWEHLFINYLRQLNLARFRLDGELRKASLRLNIESKIELVRTLDEIVQKVKSLDEIVKKYLA